jgi:hypothetical protein
LQPQNGNLIIRTSASQSQDLNSFRQLRQTEFFASFSEIRKNLALRDSPPAAGRISDIFPNRRSAILPGGLFAL